MKALGIDAYFGISAAKSSPAREMRAGVTTFLTMSYILFVNPSILSAAITVEGVDMVPQLMCATALAAAFGSLIMGLAGRYPFALAPGMGLNAYFTYSVVLGTGVPWRTALGAVFLSGLLFLAISLVGLRRLLIKAIPKDLKKAMTAGIGCFLAAIGMVNAGWVVDHPATLLTMGSLMTPGALIAGFGLIVTAVALGKRLPGAVVLGIAASSAVAIIFQAPVFNGQTFSGFNHGLIQTPAWPKDLFLQLDLAGAFDLGALAIIFTFLFVDFFDTTGTLVGLSERGGFADENGDLPRSRGAFAADGLATAAGALLGTSSTTSYIESAAGIEAGGRTGLTAVFTSLLFLLSLFLWPLLSAVPAVATAPTLIAIGAMMMFAAVDIDWTNHYRAVPCLLTILGMPLTWSITDGISLGIISWSLIHLLTRKTDQSFLLHLLATLLLLRYVVLQGG